MSVRRTLAVAALAAVLASTVTLAVSTIAAAPPHIAALKEPHTNWIGTPCSEEDRRVSVTVVMGTGVDSEPLACIQVAETMEDLAATQLTPAEVVAQTPSHRGPIPPCSPTNLPHTDCAANPVTPPEALTGADLPAGATIRVHTAGAAGEIQSCSHGKGLGVTAAGVTFSGDGWSCSRLTPPKFAPATDRKHP